MTVDIVRRPPPPTPVNARKIFKVRIFGAKPQRRQPRKKIEVDAK
jgi:hypothetical protein